MKNKKKDIVPYLVSIYDDLSVITTKELNPMVLPTDEIMSQDMVIMLFPNREIPEGTMIFGEGEE